MEVSTNIYEHKYMSFDLKEDRIAFIRKVAPKIKQIGNHKKKVVTWLTNQTMIYINIYQIH